MCPDCFLSMEGGGGSGYAGARATRRRGRHDGRRADCVQQVLHDIAKALSVFRNTNDIPVAVATTSSNSRIVMITRLGGMVPVTSISRD